VKFSVVPAAGVVIPEVARFHPARGGEDPSVRIAHGRIVVGVGASKSTKEDLLIRITEA